MSFIPYTSAAYAIWYLFVFGCLGAVFLTCIYGIAQYVADVAKNGFPEHRRDW